MGVLSWADAICRHGSRESSRMIRHEHSDARQRDEPGNQGRRHGGYAGKLKCDEKKERHRIKGHAVERFRKVVASCRIAEIVMTLTHRRRVLLSCVSKYRDTVFCSGTGVLRRKFQLLSVSLDAPRGWPR